MLINEEVPIMPTVKDCQHKCTSGCGKDHDCPCQSEHFCQNSKDTPDKPLCDKCNDTGIMTKTEWTGDDDSHNVEVTCECQQD